MPVRDFGIVMGIASMAVGRGVRAMPAGILIRGRRDSPALACRAQARPDTRSGHAWVTIHSLRTASSFSVLLAIALYGMRWTTVETDFTRNTREDSQVLEGTEFVEARMGGAGFVGAAFDVPKDPLLSISNESDFMPNDCGQFQVSLR